MVGGQTGFAVPLIVSVTGHRDLVAREVPGIRARVRGFLSRLLSAYPDRGVTVMSSLAEGADQLVAEEALSLGIALIVPLPMPIDLYREDFTNPAVRDRFEVLCSRASEILELPITPGNTRESIREHGKNRSRQYAQLGVFLCAHCHILLALWDGKFGDKLGGTGQVVRFHRDDVMPGFTPRASGSGLILTDDESDLVYHIVCSRDGPGGEPAQPLEPLDWWWYTLDREQPRTKELPERYQRVFRYTSEFSRDATKHADAIQQEAYRLLSADAAKRLPAGLRDIDHVFRAADWLAVHFQRKMMATLQAKHVLALLMGLSYIVYSDVLPLRGLLYAFLLFFVVATAVHVIGGRMQWHRRYLDYRTLAEGLRVQFYWAAAGVNAGTVSKFSHDNFLQTQDPDLGWIRNVMRVAGTECDASNYREKEGLDFAIAEWLGDESSGQLGYYTQKTYSRLRRFLRTEKLAAIGFWSGFALIVLLIFISAEAGDIVRDPLVVLMGIMLLVIGVRQSYGFSVADAELIKQYRFMSRIFSNARRRIDEAEDDDERRRILRVLGEAALEENAEWILMSRDRALDHGEVFRMSG